MKKTPKKPSGMTITIELPQGHSIATMRLDKSSGKIELIDHEGNYVKPARSRRDVHYQREKGPKFQTSVHKEGEFISFGGVEELTKLDSFFTIDTNTRVIDGRRISISCFIKWKLIPHQGHYELIAPDNQAFIFEFHHVPEEENPEMLAVLKLANDILRNKLIKEGGSIAFVTDSNLDSHVDISNQRKPIYRDHMLPSPFSLIYASTDTGNELLNKLLKICDAESTKQLQRIMAGEPYRTNFTPTTEDQNVLCTCQGFPIEELENTNIKLTPISYESMKITYE